MPADDGTEPIEDDEELYRRIPASTNWYDPDKQPCLSPHAFRPNKNDGTGISIHRAKYKSAEEAARGRRGKTYFVAVLRAGDLREHGIEVLARPQEGDPGHAEIPCLNYTQRREKKALESKDLLAYELTIRVEGPFST
jgi:hypothetical protein